MDNLNDMDFNIEDMMSDDENDGLENLLDGFEDVDDNSNGEGIPGDMFDNMDIGSDSDKDNEDDFKFDDDELTKEDSKSDDDFKFDDDIDMSVQSDTLDSETLDNADETFDSEGFEGFEGFGDENLGEEVSNSEEFSDDLGEFGENLSDTDTFDNSDNNNELADMLDNIGEVPVDEPENPSDYSDGSIVDGDDLKDEEEVGIDDRSGFINDTGNIVVQDTHDDAENGFELVYIDIDKIAITNRIRKLESVDALVQSIQSTGLLEPLVVAPTATEGLFVLLNGYRRIQACARAGKTRVPCIVNNRVSTPEIPILEAMYNHSKAYSIKEQIDYIDYLEKQKGIMNPTMIEYLLQMNSGDYTKLKDILHDDDENIVSKMLDGQYTIAAAFKKLEQRRRKESQEEKENKKAAKVYGDEHESGADQIEGSGEEADGEALTEEQIKKLAFNVNDLEDTIEDMDINEMVDESNNIEGFEPHKQKVGEREYIDPIIKKTVMARDNATCRCCRRGGEQYVDILDFHHILPVFLGGNDTPENGIMLCVACHRLVHLYSTGDLHIDPALLNNDYGELSEDQKKRYENEQIFEDEKRRFKTIIFLGSKIRQGIAQKGMNKEQFKKEHSNAGIGRRKPGKNAPQEQA